MPFIVTQKPLTDKARPKNRDRTDINLKSIQTTQMPFSLISQILNLQRTIGNQAVQRLINFGSVHPKLKISQPNDIYEQEADRVAERVLNTPEKEVQNHIDSLNFSSKAKESPAKTPHTSPDVISRIQTLKGGGEPLPDSTRAFFENRFGQDFSKVRVHTNDEAAECAKSLDSKAYTLGQEIVFGRGQYAPRSNAGKKLLAHELTHVGQQRSGDSLFLQREAASPEEEAETIKPRPWTYKSVRIWLWNWERGCLGMANPLNSTLYSNECGVVESPVCHPAETRFGVHFEVDDVDSPHPDMINPRKVEVRFEFTNLAGEQTKPLIHDIDPEARYVAPGQSLETWFDREYTLSAEESGKWKVDIELQDVSGVTVHYTDEIEFIYNPCPGIC